MTELATQELARARAARIRAGIATYLHTLADVSAAYAQRDWTALGYADWQAYVDGEFSEAKLRLSPEHRAKAVAELRLSGMSTRAIGSALGVDEKTVRNDLRGAEFSAPAEIQGADGKTYAAARPQTPAPEPEPEPEASTFAGSGHDHPSDLPGEADARPAVADADSAASEAPAEIPSSVGAGDPLADAMAEAIEQARDRVAQQRADREAVSAPREVVDAVNAATHFVPALVAIQSACEDLVRRVADVDPERAVADLPDDLRDRLAVARAAHAYLTRVIDALNRTGVLA